MKDDLVNGMLLAVRGDIYYGDAGRVAPDFNIALSTTTPHPHATDTRSVKRSLMSVSQSQNIKEATVIYPSVYEYTTGIRETPTLMDTLIKKAMDSYNSGRVTKDDLSHYLERDAGIYKGSELTKLIDHGNTRIAKKYIPQLMDTILNAFQEHTQHKNFGKTSATIVDSMSAITNYKNNSLHTLSGCGMSSILVHAIGMKDFIDTVIEHNTQQNPQFPGKIQELAKNPEFKNHVSDLLRVSTIGKTLHTNLVKGIYKDC